MTYGQLNALLKEAGLSPEQAALRFGVSNMTLRRWRHKPAGAPLPQFYEHAFRPVIRQMADEGLIAGTRPSAAKDPSGGFRSTLRQLGFSPALLSGKNKGESVLLKGLSQIGRRAEHQNEVDSKPKKLASFKSLSQDWKDRITGLTAIIHSETLPMTQKLVAYGALFYLLTPIDLIPDTIPVVGLLDDFAVLGIAFAFYLRMFPKELKPR